MDDILLVLRAGQWYWELKIGKESLGVSTIIGKKINYLLDVV